MQDGEIYGLGFGEEGFQDLLDLGFGMHAHELLGHLAVFIW